MMMVVKTARMVNRVTLVSTFNELLHDFLVLISDVNVHHRPRCG